MCSSAIDCECINTRSIPGFPLCERERKVGGRRDVKVKNQVNIVMIYV